MTAPTRGRILWAFAVLYVVWGSTYLFMRFAVVSFAPVAVAGMRFLAAGLILYALATWRDTPEPVPVPWKGHALVGILLIGGNLSVAYSVQRIPSGVSSLLVAMTPCLMVLMEWWRHKGAPPSRGIIAGLVLGLFGVATLVGPGSFGGEPVDALGAGAVLAGSVAWSAGSIYSKTLLRHASPFRTSAIQMMSGGALMFIIALATGHLSPAVWAAATPKAMLSMAYLTLLGSVLAFSAYSWLLGVTTAARVSTYAFVNPVVAVALGAFFAGEKLSPRLAAAGAIIVGAVALITWYGREPSTKPSAASSTTAAVHEAP